MEQGRHTIIEHIRDFDLEETLECGQCFRYERTGDESYLIVAKDRLLRVQQKEDSLIFYDTSMEEYQSIWEEYFDLARDYDSIKRTLIERDPVLEEAIRMKPGIHILNQDFFEMLLTFIISQNKQIPHIRQIVEMISVKFGTCVGRYQGKDYFAFPTPEQLSMVEEETFRECKVGFRAPYLVDAIQKVVSGTITQKSFEGRSNEEILQLLQTIKGVGEKVAHCVLLFGLSRKDAFPIDVWMKRVLENLYFGKDTKREVLQEFARHQYGDYGGFAQQYLFVYAREKKMKDVSTGNSADTDKKTEKKRDKKSKKEKK